MEIAFNIFRAASAGAGAAILIAGMLWVFGWAIVKVYKMLRIWHVICLALSIRLHGKDYADQQFWWAIKERASRGAYHAKIISDYALSVAAEGDKP